MEYRPTIGLEIHAELKTATKLFCNSKNDPDETRPNVNVCPICLGYPGILPTLNKEAVRYVLRVGCALGAELADYTEWDRKNYFYPDIPKGYQISQYAYPLVRKGALRGVDITRVHLEEDTARSLHEAGGTSLLDFNRAGVPLMELVTEPVIRTAAEAAAFARELQLLLRTLGAGDANMEKGEMRVEANISVSKTEALGTKVEVKNLNSFRAVERAIAYEIKRHSELLRAGKPVLQETRGWNEAKQETFSQRLKESSHDYRYFPDPDVPKLVLSEIEGFDRATLRASLPELPWRKRERLLKLGLKAEDAEMLVQDRELGSLFEATVGERADKRHVELAVNYLTSDLAGLLKTHDRATVFKNIPAEHFRELITMLEHGDISSRVGKDLLAQMARKGGSPRELAAAQGLMQQHDSKALEGIIEALLTEHPSVVDDYQKGKTNALQFLVGRGMKASKGAANPGVLRELIEKRIKDLAR